jgi:hypothetical protein
MCARSLDHFVRYGVATGPSCCTSCSRPTSAACKRARLMSPSHSFGNIRSYYTFLQGTHACQSSARTPTPTPLGCESHPVLVLILNLSPPVLYAKSTSSQQSAAGTMLCHVEYLEVVNFPQGHVTPGQEQGGPQPSLAHKASIFSTLLITRNKVSGCWESNPVHGSEPARRGVYTPPPPRDFSSESSSFRSLR